MSAAPFALLRETLASPIGTLVLLTDADGRLRVADFDEDQDRMEALLDRAYGRGGWFVSASRHLSRALRPLTRYFDGDLTAVDEVETATDGTVLQRAVWAALRTVPAGTTESYGALAARIDHPRAVRPVGAANGANPICIVVPCHRVVGANGTLTGYGGGLDRKRWLLDHEARHAGVGDRKPPADLFGAALLR
ncbi:methylated-DNA--[protein]-cysteine S-methyltransferase [Methylobacterium sp. WL12]|uniref:methylated-DNA--[protein]-cysteine S-methyltransferase n=1 Tax=Methylobacterium sp. WL12 TaxID=2603890 RepID=UPI0011C9B46D|nr:methylated-DNA--[protein]-cysteine S-methyltransferase [Methylobacterium sp. WL12]TXM76711.1 methylated-DNA--[protein]-cysteine S-methyltransferase [Methylobacterium sp. WL12]